MNEDFMVMSLANLLQNRDIFQIFDEEFHKSTWLDVTALLNSESTLTDLYHDETVPHEVLDAIVERLQTV
ncbi:MAG TPA: hypothetical protein DCP96_05385 [Lachnospiraceae bacterium]|jgi:hypothetical protein|nr:hypothetical protein [Lachnospiraceae bacterium]MDY5703820.1 hypothetical protein [Lachnospiraceae bacterium]MEE3357433.1 hypothetical protein [Lachnospiraceae bacterium]HAN51120.1 hypothetical protein [Lachnospiraceae bacterium]HBE07713.1 hypothetical protein [Lachnospiraceae bacterium]